jgi:hypothetical protein
MLGGFCVGEKTLPNMAWESPEALGMKARDKRRSLREANKKPDASFAKASSKKVFSQ